MASSALATAFVNIVPGTVQVENYLKTQLGGQVDAASTMAGGKMAAGLSNGFGSKIKGYLAPVLGTMVASFGALEAVNFFKNAITESSDLNESLNAVNVTFGKNAKGIMDLGAQAAKAVGLSKNEFNGLAVQFSAFAGTIAGKGGDVVGTIKDLTTRGADFASVMNIDVNDAMTLFQSGLAGETEPLRKYGIDLSAAAVEHYALAKGIIHGKEKMTEAEKVQARYGLLMEQTSKTTGDFGNTSEELANKQRITAAEFKNAQAALGDNLRPVMLDFVNFANTVVVPGIQGISDAMKWLGENTNISIPIFAGLAAALLVALAPAIWGAVTAVGAFTIALLANPITWIVIGVGLLVAGIVALAMNWDKVTKWIGDVWKGFVGFLSDSLKNIGQWWTDTWNNIGNFLSDTWKNITKGVTDGINGIIKWFKELPSKILDALGNAATWLLNVGKNIIDGLWNGLKSGWDSVINWVKDAANNISTTFKTILGIKSPSRVFTTHGENIGEGLVNGMESQTSAIEGAAKKMADTVVKTFDASLNDGLGGMATTATMLQQLTAMGQLGTMAGSKFFKPTDAANMASYMAQGGVQSVNGVTMADIMAAARSDAAGGPAASKNAKKTGKDYYSSPASMALLEKAGYSFAQGWSIQLEQQFMQDLMNKLQGGFSTYYTAADGRAMQTGSTPIMELTTEYLNSVGNDLVAGTKFDPITLKSIDTFVQKTQAQMELAIAQGFDVTQYKADIAKAKALLPKAPAKSSAIATGGAAQAGKVYDPTLNDGLGGYIPAMARGGLVRRATRALIGEAGPEVVTPLKDFERLMGIGNFERNQMGGGQTLIYHAAPNESIDREEALFKAMRRAKVVAGW